MPSKADREKHQRTLAGIRARAPSWERLADLPAQNLTNTEGKSIVAKLTFFDGETVTLKIKGKSYRYPIANLAAESQQLIRSAAGE